MSEKTVTRRLYHFFTYDDIWEETKKKYGLTDEQLHKQVEGLLQMWAWSDIITESRIESSEDFERGCREWAEKHKGEL